jgi:SAM-dependent methyltransferase
MESVTCDQCGGRGQRPYLAMKDHIFHVPGTFSIVQCTSCGLLFTNPRPTGDELRGLYATYYDGNGLRRPSTGFAASIRQHPGILSLWHALCGQYSSAALRKLRGNVLDIGCGTGDLLEQARTKGCRAFGVEPNAFSAEICRRKGFEVYTGSFEDIPFPPNFFDAVVLWHSVEHLSSPRSALAKIKRILKPGGHVLIWCPNADSSPAALFRQFWFGWHLPFHFYHFTPKTLTALAETAGFRVEKLRAVTPEFIFAHSLQAWMKHQKGSVSQSTGVIRFLRTHVARAIIALVFRIHDHALTGKGEFLQVELVPVTE